MPVFSDASLPESSRMGSGFSVSRQNPCRYGIRLPYWISNCQRGGTSISTGTKPLSRAVGSVCISRSMSTFACWMSLCRVHFFNKTAFSKYLPYEYQTTESNEPLIAEFNVYFLHCTASACLLILSLYRIMHDDTVKKQNFV